jgi:hypothetical protein
VRITRGSKAGRIINKREFKKMSFWERVKRKKKFMKLLKGEGLARVKEIRGI